MESIYHTYKPEGDAGVWLKLSDGESVKIRITSEPVIFTTEFKNDGEVTLSTKFGWIVWNRNENKAQVFSGGKSIFNQIASLVDEWGEPTGFDLTVKRSGTMLETRYSVTPAPKSNDLSKEQLGECAKIDILKLTKGFWLRDANKSGSDEILEEDLNAIFPE